MTTNDIDAIRKLTDAATEGPWWAWNRGVGYVIALGSPSDLDEYDRPRRELPEGMRTDIGRGEDAEFIAAARTLVPALCDEVEQLRAELRKTREVARTYREAMVGQHEWAGHLIEGRCTDCVKAADELDGDLACDQYRQWQREYENAIGTHVPEVSR